MTHWIINTKGYRYRSHSFLNQILFLTFNKVSPFNLIQYMESIKKFSKSNQSRVQGTHKNLNVPTVELLALAGPF